MLHISKQFDVRSHAGADVMNPAVQELDIRPSNALHQIMFNETMIAASNRALIVGERHLPKAIYFPCVDVEMELVSADHTEKQYPPNDGRKYWTVRANGDAAKRAAWSHDRSAIAYSALRGYIAFSLEKMQCYWRGGIEQPLDVPHRMFDDRNMEFHTV